MLVTVPDMDGEDLGHGDPDHGAVSEVEEEDVGHEEGEREPPDVRSVSPRALGYRAAVHALKQIGKFYKLTHQVGE